MFNSGVFSSQHVEKSSVFISQQQEESRTYYVTSIHVHIQTESIALIWQKYSTEYPETVFLQCFRQTSHMLNRRGKGKQFTARYSQKLCCNVQINHIFLLQICKIQN